MEQRLKSPHETDHGNQGSTVKSPTLNIVLIKCQVSISNFLVISLTCGFSATYLAQFLIRRMASMLVSGNDALHANSDRHFTASWNESIVAEKYFSNILAEK
jgi:hypothetical protein